jgi:hypothetical protein
VATPIPGMPNINQPFRTPGLVTFNPPTEMEMQYYQTGLVRYPNLATTGSFMAHPNWQAWTRQGFNCFAWALGFTDRWVNGGCVTEMERVFGLYYMHQCTRDEAEVDLYRILDAPSRVPVGRVGNTIHNARADVMHAHRRDHTTMDAAPNLGCTSKMRNLGLLAHNRHGLEDHRGHAATNSRVEYGSIFQHWRRNPATHPDFPGNEGNPYPPQAHYPDHRIFEMGPGQHPEGHPGNSIGAPSLARGNEPAGPKAP